MKLLIEEFKINSTGKQQEAGFLLSRIGEFSAEYLLDILEKSQNRAERSQILRLMPDLGSAALPALTERLNRGGTWFYLRNLILILGKIGTENEVGILAHLLSHEDFRVRQEALNSIYAIGGKYRGDILLSAFASADETTKGVIADMLGALRYENAAPVFLEILGAKSLFLRKSVIASR
ncbi:MAG: HEAT repeat domain-containing protein [Desulfobacteraceae bacterium]|nr:HEAT repeat domain-containing protein [Desulfobacteraceae bacterium]